MSAAVVSAVASAAAVVVLTALLRQLARLTRDMRRFMQEQKWVLSVAVWATASVSSIMTQLDIDGPPPPARPGKR